MKKILSLVLVAVMLCGSIFALASCEFGESDPVVKVIDIALTEEQYAFAVPKGDTEMLNAINAFMTKIKGNGTFETILNKYFGDGTPTPITSAAEMKNDGSQLIVATNAAFAPFEYMEGENYYGVDLEIMSLFAAELGKELYIYNMDFDAVCLAVSSAGGSYESEDENGNPITVPVTGGIADIAAAGLTINATRQQILDFSDSYYNASQMIIAAADDTTFDSCKNADDVLAILNSFDSSVTVCVQSGTTGQFFCEGDEDWGFDGFAFTTSPLANGSLATQNILNGTAKYVIIDEGPAKAIVEKINAAN